MLKYLKESGHLVPLYTLGDNFDPIRNADADYAGCLVDRKSTCVIAHFLSSSLISWGFEMKNSVTLSTTETKYIATTSYFAQLLWIKQQLNFGIVTNTIPLMSDNTSALNIVKNPMQHKRTKHIDVRHYLLRDNVQNGSLCMKFYKTKRSSG